MDSSNIFVQCVFYFHISFLFFLNINYYLAGKLADKKADLNLSCLHIHVNFKKITSYCTQAIFNLSCQKKTCFREMDKFTGMQLSKLI